MLRFDYDSLTALAAVVREGGFESAAKSLAITQSAVSQRIKALEEKVGSLLIIRGRPCVPTKIGLQLCRHLEQVTLLQHELNQRVGNLVDGPDQSAATVRVSVNNDSLATWFPAVIKRAAEDLNMLFDVVPDDQEHTEGSLKSGDSLAIITSNDQPTQGCRRISLGAMPYIAVANRQFFEEHFADGVSPRTLQGTSCLAFDRKDTIQEQWMNICFGETVSVKEHFVPSYEGYFACCLNGSGWGLVPATAAQKFIDDGELIELMPGKAVDVSLHWQASTQSSEILRRLGEVVLEEAMEVLLPDSYRPE
ncbi:MAG: ArgP/LysG family DNA-binding transcriptional regulator [Boseongicola sp.]|nr:MAG: ArgP/LysG family DNA-binding transcriptional regulator [Boseongicola sp.]